jgi:hypothetical protein
MRPIDADALLERMEKRLNDLTKEYGKYYAYTDGYEEGYIAVEEAPTVEIPRGEWMPCKERLPNEGHGITYLISAMDGKAMRVTFAKYQPMSKTFRLSGLAGHWRPIAWMPLPKAYKSDMRGEGE